MSQLDAFGARAFGDAVDGTIEDKTAEIRSKISADLPRAMIAALKAFGGAAVVFDKEVKYRPVAASKWTRPDGTQSLELLYGLHNDKNGLMSQFDKYQNRVPKGVLPIGEGPGGNLICLVVQGPKKGCIYFWDHENERPLSGVEGNDFGNMSLIADSFDDFVGMLTAEDPEPDQDDGDDGIVESWLSDDL